MNLLVRFSCVVSVLMKCFVLLVVYVDGLCLLVNSDGLCYMGWLFVC